MKRALLLSLVIGVGLLPAVLGASAAHAAPLPAALSPLINQAKDPGSITKVWFRGFGLGWHGGWGWRRPYWGGYGYGYRAPYYGGAYGSGYGAPYYGGGYGYGYGAPYYGGGYGAPNYGGCGCGGCGGCGYGGCGYSGGCGW